MEENDDLSQLEQLLCADLNENNEIVPEKKSFISEVDIFQEIHDKSERSPGPEVGEGSHASLKISVVHNGDTDSSDDEEKRNYTERKYNDYGSEVKKVLDHQEQERLDKKLDFVTRLRQTNAELKHSRSKSFIEKADINLEHNSKNLFCVPERNSIISADVYTDPVFGIRITKPLISSAAFLDRMQGRDAINMLRVKRYVENDDFSKDWVIAGVIVRKSSSKQSQKGNQFLVWTLSDLKDDMKTVSMFLFRKAYSDLWKTSEGTVVAVLNPNVLDRSQNSTDQACLSVETSNRVMILGQSKDLGVCKSSKKNGAPCTAFINLSQGEHCIYHIKQEYQKYSRRLELQSSTMGKGLVNLRNKVLGKDTVIYGGKTYTALPKGNSKKVREKDQNRLMSLSDYYKSDGDNLMRNKAPYGAGCLKNNMEILHSPALQRTSDVDRLNKLSGLNSSTLSSTKILSPSPPPANTFKSKISQSRSLAEKVASSPKLGKAFSLQGSGTIDLNISYGQRAANKAKANAIRLVQQNGGIPKLDPNNMKGTEIGKKRALDKLNTSESNENNCKKLKSNEITIMKNGRIMPERFKKILEATSAHENLIKQHENDEQDKYFDKLEKKEAMEEKMLNTFKLPCKAVRCIKCKYTAFSASQLCKDERHPLKVLDAFKRFFKCADCSNRTISLEIIPLHACSNCKGSRWEKAPMLREKKVTTLSEGLSIRGEEETFIGGQVNAGKNINLLVPDNDN